MFRRRFCVSSIQDSQEYLTHCLTNGSQLSSTVFKGTLYELYVKSFLEKNLHCYDLVKIGGANDKGADIIGRWNLLPFYQTIQDQSLKLNSTALLKRSIESRYFDPGRSVVKSLHDIDLVVQCKNHKSKLGPQYIREAGIVLNHLKLQRNNSFMFLVSPNALTSKAIDQMNQTNCALIHLAITPLTCMDFSKDLSNWIGGGLNSVYINSYAKKLLNGFKLEQQLKKYILD